MENNWRDIIISELISNNSKMIIVADPDGLLLEEKVLNEIHSRGYNLIPFEDHVVFRYTYESQFRSSWDKEQKTEMVALLHTRNNNLNGIPYDFLQVGRKLHFSIAEIFTGLSYPVVNLLDKAYFDTLYKAVVNNKPGELGENATKDFILRHVFGIAPEIIKNTSDLLSMLLKKHYNRQKIPKEINEHLIWLLRKNENFAEWPLKKLIPDREAFLTFLQERWPVYLDSVAEKTDDYVHEDYQAYNMTIPGPVKLPFEHQDVRVYIDSFFLEGTLRAVYYEKPDKISKKWAKIGLLLDSESNTEKRAKKLIKRLSYQIPKKDSRHTEWIDFSKKWAEFNVLICRLQGNLSKDFLGKITELRNIIDSSFEKWLLQGRVDESTEARLPGHFRGLINLPSTPPVMLHHVPKYLARLLKNKNNYKIAMVVIDGMSFDDWIVIRKTITENGLKLKFSEDGVFAWIPTITSISRQALFSGFPPYYFPNSIKTTNKEQERWRKFWENEGFSKTSVSYIKSPNSEDLKQLQNILDNPKVQILGLVIDIIDKIMHGTPLGKAGMHNQVNHWAKQSYLSEIINMLLSNEFMIFITSDHGNVEAKGCGRPSEGVITEQQGARVRIYSDKKLRKKTKEKYPSSIEWPTSGLPEDILPLIAPARKAFIQKGKTTVSHGGCMLEEVIVPLISISR